MSGAPRAVVRARRPVVLVLTAALAAGCGTAAAPSGTGPAGGHRGPGAVGGHGHGRPARDSFQGSIRSATGTYSGDTGRAHIYLHPTGAGPRRSVTVTFAGLPCRGANHCVELSGTLTGTIAAGPGHIPDVGHAYVLSGAGSIHPLGRARGRGAVQGTGFIARGEESLSITVTGASGSVTLDATSPPVHGFTSP